MGLTFAQLQGGTIPIWMARPGLVQYTIYEAVHGGQTYYVPDLIQGTGYWGYISE